MPERQHPLIEPDVRFARIRLSDHLHRTADAGAGRGAVNEAEPPVQQGSREGARPAGPHPMFAPEVDTDPITDELVEGAERGRAVAEVEGPRPSPGPRG